MRHKPRRKTKNARTGGHHARPCCFQAALGYDGPPGLSVRPLLWWHSRLGCGQVQLLVFALEPLEGAAQYSPGWNEVEPGVRGSEPAHFSSLSYLPGGWEQDYPCECHDSSEPLRTVEATGILLLPQ